MNTRHLSFALLTLLPFTLSVGAHASEKAAVADQLLLAGDLPVEGAGPYVERGTYRIQVETKLGRPSAVLGDGRWLYDGYCLQQGGERGALVIQFKNGKVAELRLVHPTVALALRSGKSSEARYVTRD